MVLYGQALGRVGGGVREAAWGSTLRRQAALAAVTQALCTAKYAALHALQAAATRPAGGRRWGTHQLA